MQRPHDRHRRGGALAAILLTILILGVLGVTAIVATGLYLASNSRITARTSRGETSIETPFGAVHVRDTASFDPKRFGVPLYPGAVRRPNTHKLASLHFDFGEQHKEFYAVAAEYRTFDSLDKVADFYHHELPHWMFSQKDDGGMRLELTERGYRKIVFIHEEDGETRIALASVGEPASN